MHVRGHSLRAFNYMDDDTCQVRCACGWESTGHEDEDSAEIAHENHVRDIARDLNW